MADESRFELTWTQRTGPRGPEPYLAFEVLDDAKQTKTAYGGVFRVCAAPRCSCLSVRVHCASCLPDGNMSPDPVRWFWLDVRNRVLELTPELQAEPGTLLLAQFVSAGLPEKAWEELHRWFWAAKLEAIETADISEIDINNLPNADDGHMVPFVEVFPLGLSLNFTFEQADWAADEAYCVQPSCGCTQTILSFLKLRDADGKKTSALQNVPAIRYNYRSRATEVLAPSGDGTPSTGKLLMALKSTFSDLHQRLELHHRIMQSVYARHYLERTKLKKESLQAQLRPKPPKSGRNDPCPCGSGKKFKKCCGA